MTLVELKKILEAAGFPVAYSHFVETTNEPLPTPPFICYLCTFSANFAADDSVYYPAQNVQIELYTDEKDLEAESRVESVLTANNIPFGTTESFIESESLYQKIYEVRVL